MNKPLTLQQYLEMISLQRKKQFFMMNEVRNIPNPINLDTQNKIDSIIAQILEYIKHLIGEGPLFGKFQYMMQNLHKTFQRQLAQLTSAAIYKKTNSDKKYLEEIKKANLQLNNYLLKCEKQTEQTGQKLEQLLAHKKQFKKQEQTLPPQGKQKLQANKVKNVEVKGNFDDLDFDQPTKIEKINKGHMNKVILPGSTTKASPANPLMSQLFKK